MRNRPRCLCGLLALGSVLLGGAQAADKADFVVGRLGGGGLSTSGEITSLDYSPDGRMLAGIAVPSRVADAEVRLWETDSGKLVRCFTLDGQPTRLRFSSDGRRLLTAHRAIDPETGRSSAAKFYRAICFSRDGKLLAGYGDSSNILVVQQRDGGKPLYSLNLGEAKTRMTAAAFSWQGDRLAVATSTGKLMLLDATSGEKQMTLDVERVARIAFSPDGRRFATVDGASSVCLYDVAEKKLLRRLSPPDSTHSRLTVIAYSPDGRKLAAGGSFLSTILVWDLDTNRLDRTIASRLRETQSLAFSPDGRCLAAAGEGAGGTKLQVWSVAGGRELYVPNGPRSNVTQIAFSANNRRLVTAGADGMVCLWDVRQPRPLLTRKADCSLGLQFSPDGWLFSTVGRYGVTRVWEADTGNEVLAKQVPERRLGLTSACISPDTNLLVQGTREGEIDLLDVNTGATLRSIQAYKRGDVESLAISPDGRLIAGVGEQRDSREVVDSVQLWDVATGRLLQSCSTGAAHLDDERTSLGDTLWGLQFSPGGAMLAARSARGRGIFVWETKTGRRIAHLPSNSGPYCFYPTGRYFLHQQGANLELIELVTEKSCLSLPLGDALGRSSARASAVAVSPDGSLLACGATDTNVVLLLSLAPRNTDPAKRGAAEDEDMERWWHALAQADAGEAYRAAWLLAEQKNRAVAFLDGRIAPTPRSEIDGKLVSRLIHELDDDSFDVRDRATHELQRIGPAVLAQLKQRLEGDLDTELKFRLTRIVSAIESPTRRFAGEPLRRLRAIGVLERVGTTPAGDVLKRLAQGEPTARESIDARQALWRLEARLSGP